MAKKKHKHKWKHRNAVVARPRARAVPEDTSLRRLGYTAAGAAGTALLGSFLARQGWAPKTIAGALTAVGAGLAWKGDGQPTQNVGAGTMSAAGSQLALMLIDDREQQKAPPAKKPANADELPPGALESAFLRARDRLALDTGDDSQG